MVTVHLGLLKIMCGKRNTRSVVLFTGTCCYGVNLGPFPKIALQLSDLEVQIQQTLRLLTCVKLCVKINAMPSSLYTREMLVRGFVHANMGSHLLCLTLKNVSMRRNLYTRKHNPCSANPKLCILWGASHNVQRVAKHGYEQYLAKYISRAEPSFNIDLPNNASEPLKYLRTRVIGSVEAVEVLMSFHQSQMTRQVIYLPTDGKPTRRMLKSKRDLVQFSGVSRI